MIYTLLSLFNKTCHFSSVRALWCSGKRVRLYVESTGFDFFLSGYELLFSLFLFCSFLQQPQAFRKGKAKLNRYL